MEEEKIIIEIWCAKNGAPRELYGVYNNTDDAIGLLLDLEYILKEKENEV